MSAKDRLCFALDVPDRATALDKVAQLARHVGMFKIGKQLFTAEGPTLVREIVGMGQKVFLDLKYHDIPNTVAGAVASAVQLGVSILNVHCLGGIEMMRAAAESALETADVLGIPRPVVLGVTLLTSMNEDTLKRLSIQGPVLERVCDYAQLAYSAGLDGVIASALEAIAIRQRVNNPDFIIGTPGIRFPEDKKNDQERVTTPSDAMRDGATFVVMGRPITGPEAAARAVAEIERGLRERGV